VARACVLAISALAEGPASIAHSVDLARVIADAGLRMLPPASVTWALLDGNLFWQPLRPATRTAVDGRSTGTELADVSYLETPGLPASGPRHLLEVHAGPQWQLWALTRDSDGSFSYQLLRENR